MNGWYLDCFAFFASVCLFVRLFVCAFALITCAIYYIIRYYATAVYTFGGLQAKLQQMKVVLDCLDGENLVGSSKDPGFLAYSY